MNEINHSMYNHVGFHSILTIHLLKTVCINRDEAHFSADQFKAEYISVSKLCMSNLKEPNVIESWSMIGQFLGCMCAGNSCPQKYMICLPRVGDEKIVMS